MRVVNEQLELRDKILGWLADEDYEVKIDAPPPNAPIEWIIKATSKVPLRANIIIQQPKTKKDRIVITLGVMISDHHKRGLKNLKVQERAEIIYNLLSDLQSICPECLILAQPSYLEPESFVFTKIIYYESLERQGFLDSIRKLVNMFSMLVIGLSSKFGPFKQAQKRSDYENMGYI